jgi:hypothetical protein
VGTNVNLTLKKVEVEARAAIGGARKRQSHPDRPSGPKLSRCPGTKSGTTRGSGQILLSTDDKDRVATCGLVGVISPAAKRRPDR